VAEVEEEEKVEGRGSVERIVSFHPSISSYFAE